jgi:hypothetical protein
VDWIGVAQDRNRWRGIVTLVLNLRVPRQCGETTGVLTAGGLLSGAQLQRVSSNHIH